MLFVAALSIGRDGFFVQELIDELFAIETRHGVKQHQGGETVPAELFANVKDQGRLFHDLCAFANKHPKGGDPPSPLMKTMEGLLPNRMEDVKVTGDTATARMILKDGETQIGRFIRVKGMWYIDPARKTSPRQ